ncbi:uncharacterized protein LOC122299783 isoform X3 [Carya illinoinensis]|uniref:uncharacterized protein LOC122299783 isoform X3 n=1 Tax=Carya illinoinensis TaxID=32201 RepID=UPI001C718A9E|nr:uncharacterized protein LOC122299783 isoform X3 [Carya illinoinensis]
MADNVDQMSSKTTREMKKRDLLKNAMKGQWREVVEIYKNEAWIHKEKITRSGETALHIAVSDGQKKIVEQLITAIKSQTYQNAKKAVSVENKQGNTALHFAASKEKERPSMCESIAEVDPFLVFCRNCEGETPIFLAAFHGNRGAFLYLHRICAAETNQDGYDYSTKYDGNTTLHSAINGQHFDLAIQIAQLYPKLANSVNEKGVYPLSILAAKPSAFRSGKPLESIWHRAIYNPSTSGTNGTGEGIHANESDPTIGTDVESNRSPDEYSGRHDDDHDHGGIFSRPYFKLAYSKSMLIISWSMWISSWLLYNFTSELKGIFLLPFGIKDRETPILTAAKYGVIEMIERILELYPLAVYDETPVTNKNIVLLAVENRQIHVYQLLLQKTIPRDSLFGHVDDDGNSALHLAAKLATNTPGMVPAGLRVLWEIRWYQFVKDSMPSNFFPLHNREGKTPIEIFTESHKEVIESGGKWLSSTSSSSSVVATVIASVAFATAATIPGGLKQDRGTPMYENQPTFYIFAISSLFALFFSITSAVMFIVLTSSPYEVRAFSSDLPKKLLMSLMMLFMGIVSMMISFCASHFFLFQDKHEKTGALVFYVVMVALVIYLTIKNSSVFLNLLRFTFSDVPERLDEDDF